MTGFDATENDKTKDFFSLSNFSLTDFHSIQIKQKSEGWKERRKRKRQKVEENVKVERKDGKSCYRQNREGFSDTMRKMIKMKQQLQKLKDSTKRL